MKLTKKRLKEIISEEITKLNEAPPAKATVSNPKNWHDNMWNASGELLRVVYWLSSLQLKASPKIKKDAKLKGIINNLKKLERQLDNWYDKTDLTDMQEAKLKESWDSPQGYSSKEAKKVVDGAIRDYSKDLRKVQGRVVKDWMSKAKAGVIDYFDIVRGLTTGDITKAHPYESDFLHKVLNKDKIIQRFRQYFGGNKGFKSRRK